MYFIELYGYIYIYIYFFFFFQGKDINISTDVGSSRNTIFEFPINAIPIESFLLFPPLS